MQLRRLVPVVAAVVFAVAAPLAAGAAASSSSPIESTGSIVGTVTGVDGDPLAGACVNVQQNLSQVGNVTTDEEGHYSLGAVATSNYEYEISVDPTCSADAYADDYEVPSSRYAVVRTANAVEVDFQLVLGGSISGRTLDQNGYPLANVCVELQGDSWGFWEEKSDQNGDVLVNGVPAGDYRLQFDGCLDGQDGADVQPQFYNNTQDKSKQATISVVAGQQTTLDGQRMRPGADIAIKLVDASGAVLKDVRPAVMYWNAPQGLNAFGSVDGPLSDGTWVFHKLLPIEYSFAYIYCPADGCRPGPIGFYKGQGPAASPSLGVVAVPGEPTSLQDTVVIPPFSTTTTTLTASSNPAVVGRQVTITAHVSAPAGAATPSGIVYPYDEDQPGLPWGQIDTIDSSGTISWTMSGLSEGTHHISVAYYGDGESLPSTAKLTLTVNPAPSTGDGGSSGGGSSGGGGGPVASSPVSGTVAAGGSLSSDPAGTTPSASNPLVVGVTSPNGGSVSIDKSAPDTQVSHYRILNVGATITAPAASAADPLKLSFQVFDGSLPAGAYASDLTVFRDGVPVAACAKPGVVGPDPCVTSSETADGVSTIDVLSSHASTWDVEAAQVGRVAGSDRVATAAAVALDSFPNGGAGAVVLARADDFPDALVGAPLAAAKNAPLLLTQGAQLPKATADALTKVLAKGGMVYALGGPKAVPNSVTAQLTGMGYQVTRFGGADRYATAVAVADALGDPGTVLLATGANFPDALAAGPAAAHAHGAVLLTDGDTLPAATSAYLAAHPGAVYAVGGPAAKADPAATSVVGADRYATAADLATKLFTNPSLVGVATGTAFPDALSGGAQLARAGGPLLLATPTGVPAPTSGYLAQVKNGLAAIHLFGGPNALTDNVTTQLKNAL